MSAEANWPKGLVKVAQVLHGRRLDGMESEDGVINVSAVVMQWTAIDDGIDSLEESIRVSTAVMDLANTHAVVGSDPEDGGPDNDTFIPPEDDDLEESGGIEDTSDESAWGNDFPGRSSGWQPPRDGNRLQ